MLLLFVIDKFQSIPTTYKCTDLFFDIFLGHGIAFKYWNNLESLWFYNLFISVQIDRIL